MLAPRSLIPAGLFLIAAGGILLVSSVASPDATTDPPAEAGDAVGTPSLALVEPSLDLGRIGDVGRAEGAVSVRNVGGADAVILFLEPS